MSTAFTDTERAILRIVQFQLPDTLTPYADIAREVGTDEETVLNAQRDGRVDRRRGRQRRHRRGGGQEPAHFPRVFPPDFGP